jgi:RHS repeat-associated protein
VNTIAFSYSGLGNRIKKSCTHSPSSYYVLDPSGNTLAMYTKEVGGSYELEELYTYGSSRLGAVKYRNNAPLGHSALEAVESFLEYGAVGNGSSLGAVCYTEPISRAKFLGYKTYELSNHLGNVLSVVQDYKQHRFNPQNPSEAWNYMPICNSFNDYYPFGMVMPGRSFNSNSYDYGFNGQLKDDEIAGSGNSISFSFRQYDPRLGRMWAVDPLAPDYPFWTPYAFAGNMPIWAGDSEGLQPKFDNIQDRRLKLVLEAKTPAQREKALQQKRAEEKAQAYGVLFGGAVGLAGVAVAYFGWEATGIFLLEEAAETAFESVTGIPVIIDPFDIAERAVKGAFKDAAAKDLRTFFKNNADETAGTIVSRLQKSVNTHQRRIDEHKGYIADPKKKYGDEWDTFSDERKKNEIHHWKEDIKRHEAYRDSKQQAIEDVVDEAKKQVD